MRICIFLVIISISKLFSQEGGLVSESTISYPIYFEYRVGELDSLEERRLPILFRNFDSFTITRIDINAFCDERGTAKKNLILSKKRASSIFKKIEEIIKRIDTNGAILITAEGKGFLPLIGKDNIEEQRSRNRRGDVTIYYGKKAPVVATKTKKGKQVIPPKAPDIKIDQFFSQAKPGQKMELKVFFEGGRSVLLPGSYFELDTLVSILKANDTLKIKILGHIYAGGNPVDIDAYDEEAGNNRLSENRARVVYEYLVKKKIKKTRLSYEGLGGRFPTGISPNRDRRVEIEIAGKPANQAEGTAE